MGTKSKRLFYFSSGHSLRRDKIEMPAVNKEGSTSLVTGGKNTLNLITLGKLIIYSRHYFWRFSRKGQMWQTC